MHSFVFSGKAAPRLARHLVFWVSILAGTFVTHLPYIKNWGDNQEIFASFIETLWLCPVYMAGVYSALYIALPLYLRKRKISSIIWYALIILTITVPAGYLIAVGVARTLGLKEDAYDCFAWGLHNCMGNLITVTIAAVIIKIMKDYWLRQRENDLLAIENIRNKLNLLKVQMHPKILFGSLERISLEIDSETGKAPEMILQLSDLLSYLLYESESEQVPLNKEVQMIENYLALKKLEDKERIDVRMITDGQFDNHAIAPGLLLPLLEIGIERSGGAKELSPTIVQLRANGSRIHFSLTNPARGNDFANDPVAQTTLLAVRERLRNANFKKSRLDFESGVDSLTINMQYLAHGTT